MMSFKECIEKEILIKTIPDLERAIQISNMALLRYKFWNRNIDDEYITLKIEAYYDIIKELIFAIVYKNGYNCHNHLCLISYLKEITTEFDYEINKINELRTIRNEINYRGLMVKSDYFERNELEFRSIIQKLSTLAASSST